MTNPTGPICYPAKVGYSLLTESISPSQRWVITLAVSDDLKAIYQKVAAKFIQQALTK